jgi:hypothetical protein
MSKLPANVPSLARAFEPDRKALQKILADTELSAAQIVSESRRALDRTGQTFAENTSDPSLHRAGLWLLEMVKAGAGVLDQGTRADIIWHEVPKPKRRGVLGQSLFYAAALAFFVLAFVDGSRVAMASIGVLAGIRALDPANLAAMRSRLPFIKKPKAIEDHSGRTIKAEARISADAGGFVDALAESLRTADHILARLSEPKPETHWRTDARLMGLMQGLLEAAQAEDGDFALKLVGQDLESLLASEGISTVAYSKKTAKLFDVLPGIGHSTPQPAAPALMRDGEIIRRGTVWGADSE